MILLILLQTNFELSMNIFKFLKQSINDSANISASKSKNSSKIYLNVPYKQKDIVKKLGGKWDSQKKQWFIPEGMDQNLFKKWLPLTTGNLKADYFYLAQTYGKCIKCKNENLLSGIVLPKGHQSLEEDEWDQDNLEIESSEIPMSFQSSNFYSLLSHIGYISNDALKEIHKYAKNYTLCYSHTLDKSYFMLKCQICLAPQGDNFLMNERDSPLAPSEVEDFSKINFQKILTPIEIHADGQGIGYPPIEYYFGEKQDLVFMLRYF